LAPIPTLLLCVAPIATSGLFFPSAAVEKKLSGEKRKVCLDFHLGRCKGPCAGKIKEEEYRKLADSLVLFLRGRYRETMRQLKELMKESAEKLNFEEAAKYRDEIKIISRMKGDEDEMVTIK